MFLQQLINGITIGGTYALVAVGYSMIFSVLGLINFSNGSLYMLGGYVTLMLYLKFNGFFLVAFALSIVIVGFVGYCIDRIALRQLRKKNSSNMASLITTLGIGIMIDNSIQLLFGSEPKPFPNMLDFGKFYIGEAIVNWSQVIILCISILLMIVLSFVVYRTKIGKAMRAISQNPNAALLMGIDVQKVISITFIISAGMAAIAGTLVSIYYQSVDINMGFQVGMKTFAAAVLGGVGNLPGSMVGGLTIGMLETIGASYISSGYRDAIAFAVMILVLLVKPSGLFGKKQYNKL